MTDRLSPDDDLLLAYVAGSLDAPLRAELEVRLNSDPALKAEVEGLLAVRTLLDNDAQWGRDSAVDAPPPHLLSAILNAEIAARPDEIRQAVALARSAPDTQQAKPFWARMQSWMMGGGVAVGAAAAVLFVVSRAGDHEPTAPAAAAAPTAERPGDVSPPAPPAEPNALAQAVKTAAPAGEDNTVDAWGDKEANGKLAERAGGEGKNARNAADKDLELDEAKAEAKPALDPPRPDSGRSNRAENDLKGGLADNEADGTDGLAANLQSNEKKKSEPPPPPKALSKSDAPASPQDSLAFDDGDALRDGRANHAPAPTTPPMTAPMTPPMTTPAPPPPMAAPTTTTPSAPGPTGVGSGGYASAQETTQGFAELRRQKASKKIEREKESAAKKKPTVSRGAAPATEEALTPTEARESIERQKRLDEASLMVTTAERELAAGRPQNALEISRRAESAAGSSLGLVPASTQTRAHVALKQFQDAARTATRLLQGDASDVVIVDGLIAGADAAEAIGDRRLARSLLQKALLPANKDKARRAVAEQKLAVINARDIRDRDAYEAPAAAAPPAKSSASDSSSGY